MLNVNNPSVRRWVCGLLLFLTAFWAFTLNVQRARDLGVFENASVWVLDAVPVALTHMYLPWNPHYTLSAKVRDAYYPTPRTPPTSAERVNEAIAKISAMDFRNRDDPYALLGNDDKGIVDFVEIAFRVFGLKIQAVATLYYALLAFSSLIFFWSYRKSPLALSAMICVLFASYQLLPYTVFNPQLNSPIALRCLPMLALVACLHCTTHCFRNESRFDDIIALLIQILFIVFIIHVRSSAIWQALAVIAAGLAAASLKWRTATSPWPGRTLKTFASASTPVLMMAAGILALNAYRSAVFPTEYKNGEQIMTRVIWHNVYSGFALHPKLAESHGLRIDDVSVVEDVGRFLKSQGRSDLWSQIGGDSTNFSELKWAAYDRMAFRAVVAICTTEIVDCLETILVYKPYYFFDSLLWFYNLREKPSVMDAFKSKAYGDVVPEQIAQATKMLERRGFTGAPWGGGFATVFLLMCVALSISPWRTGAMISAPLLLSGSLMAGASLVPSIFGYPVPHGMVDSVVAINALLQFVAVLIGTFLIRSAIDSIRRQSAAMNKSRPR